MFMLSMYVPYEPALWNTWWSSIMKTIASASSLGMIIFIAVCCIGIFKVVFHYWL